MIGVLFILILIVLAFFKKSAVNIDKAYFTKDDTINGLIHSVLWLIYPNISHVYKWQFPKLFIKKYALLYPSHIRDLAFAITLSKSLLLGLLTCSVTLLLSAFTTEHTLKIMGVMMTGFACAAPFIKIHKAYEKKSLEIIRALPAFIQQIALLIKSGMTFEKSIDTIWSNISKEEGTYILLNRVYLEREKGVGIFQAFRVLPELLHHKAVHHLSILISQISTTGVHKFADQLIDLSERILRERQTMIKTMSEQLSTKMLMPLVVSMATIMTLLIYPILTQL